MLRQRDIYNLALNDQCQQNLPLKLGQENEAAKQAADHQDRAQIKMAELVTEDEYMEKKENNYMDMKI